MAVQVWKRGKSDTNPNHNREPAFQPASETPVGYEVLVPSRRGFGRGPTVNGDMVPGTDTYFARAQAMHASRAAAADRRTECAADQRTVRRERRSAD